MSNGSETVKAQKQQSVAGPVREQEAGEKSEGPCGLPAKCTIL